MSFVERLKEQRKVRKLTQQEMADILHIPKNTYIKYERGLREPRLAQLQDIAQYLNVSLGFLLGESDEANSGVVIGDVAIRTVLDNPDFFKRFDVYSDSLRGMVGSYISRILGLEYGCVDLFYMQLRLVEEFEEIYNLAQLSFEINGRNSEPYEKFLKANQTLRRHFDEFLCLVQNPEFYKETKEQKPHFGDDILAYRYSALSENG